MRHLWLGRAVRRRRAERLRLGRVHSHHVRGDTGWLRFDRRWLRRSAGLRWLQLAPDLRRRRHCESVRVFGSELRERGRRVRNGAAPLRGIAVWGLHGACDLRGRRRSESVRVQARRVRSALWQRAGWLWRDPELWVRFRGSVRFRLVLFAKLPRRLWELGRLRGNLCGELPVVAIL